MPEVDLTVTISVIIALCAILSPILTAIINNCHDTKLKKLEYEHLEREEERKHERELYEGYIRAAGSCIQYPGKEQKTNFGEHSSLLAYAVPDEEIRKDIILLEKTIDRSDKAYSVELLVSISQRLRQIRQPWKYNDYKESCNYRQRIYKVACRLFRRNPQNDEPANDGQDQKSKGN